MPGPPGGPAGPAAEQGAGQGPAYVCPACGTPAVTAGGPGCLCAGRAARAARAGRSQEIAEAEDFDPLRVRPYVTLATETDQETTAFRTAGPLPPLAANAGPAVAAAPPASHHRAARRRRPLKAAVLSAAAVAMIGTAAFAGGLFTGEEADKALPDEGHPGPATPSAPDTASPEAAVASASTSSSSSPSAGSSASTSPTGPPSRSTRPVTPKASSPAEPTASATRSPGTQGLQSSPPPAAPPAGADGSLRPGDSGPAVVELQNRLAAMHLYQGTPDGRYDQRVTGAVAVYQAYRHVSGDPQGVYGPNTRRALESESGSGSDSGHGPGRGPRGPGRGH